MVLDSLPARRFAGGRLVVQQDGDAWQLAALEELERRAAAGRDVGHLVGQALLLDRGHRVAAADDDGRAVLGALGEQPRDAPACRAAKDGTSKTPSGPFQKTVLASASASAIELRLALPMSTMCHDAGIFLPARLVLGAAR